jgi:hypothetical protein
VRRSTAALVIRAGFFFVPVPLDVLGFHLVRAAKGTRRTSMRTVGELLFGWRKSTDAGRGTRGSGRGVPR